MSNLDKDPETARQGQRSGHLIVILTISTVLAALAMWGLYTLWASNNQINQIDEAGSVSEAEPSNTPGAEEGVQQTEDELTEQASPAAAEDEE